MPGATNIKASTSQAKFILEATRRGWEVAVPFYDGYAYDYLLRSGGKWKTVQVKTAFDHGCKRRYVSLRRCNEKGTRVYNDGDFDILCAVDGDNVWLIPWNKCKMCRYVPVTSPNFRKYRIT